MHSIGSRPRLSASLASDCATSGSPSITACAIFAKCSFSGIVPSCMDNGLNVRPGRRMRDRCLIGWLAFELLLGRRQNLSQFVLLFRGKRLGLVLGEDLVEFLPRPQG